MSLPTSMALRISIHALREEGDVQHMRMTPVPLVFQSTPSARRATTCVGSPK